VLLNDFTLSQIFLVWRLPSPSPDFLTPVRKQNTHALPMHREVS